MTFLRKVNKNVTGHDYRVSGLRMSTKGVFEDVTSATRILKLAAKMKSEDMPTVSLEWHALPDVHSASRPCRARCI